MKIIGISGRAGSGKDTAAKFFVDQHGYVIVALADELKRTAKKWYGFTDAQLWGPSELRNTPSPKYPQLICRDVLQKLGTEVGRSIYANTWVDITLTTAREMIEGTEPVPGQRMRPGYAPALGLVWNYDPGMQPSEPYYRVRAVSKTGGIVIPDMRFKNELAAIRDAGGYLTRVQRAVADLEGAAGLHKSETEQTEIPDTEFDALFNNSGTIPQLGVQVDQVVERLRDRERRRIYTELVPKKRAEDPVLGAMSPAGKGIQPFTPGQENVPPFKRRNAVPGGPPPEARPFRDQLPPDEDMDTLFPVGVHPSVRRLELYGGPGAPASTQERQAQDGEPIKYPPIVVIPSDEELSRKNKP